jgi:hypothetical protein
MTFKTIHNTRTPLLVAILALFACCHLTITDASFVFAPQSTLSPKSKASRFPSTTTVFLSQPPAPRQDNNNNNNKIFDNNYNDVAFGFVFLGAITAAQDYVFSGLFMILSAVAAIATQQGKLPASNQVPAAVAGFTLISLPALTAILDRLPLGEEIRMLQQSTNPSAPWIELALCSVSMAYGFVFAASTTSEDAGS